MKRLMIDVEDDHVDIVLDLLSSMKENVIININVQDKHHDDNLEKEIEDYSNPLDLFRSLVKQSNNQRKLTMSISMNTNEMDGNSNGLF